MRRSSVVPVLWHPRIKNRSTHCETLLIFVCCCEFPTKFGKLPSKETIRIVPLFGHVCVEAIEPALLVFAHGCRDVTQKCCRWRHSLISEETHGHDGNFTEGSLHVHLVGPVSKLPR